MINNYIATNCKYCSINSTSDKDIKTINFTLLAKKLR